MDIILPHQVEKSRIPLWLKNLKNLLKSYEIFWHRKEVKNKEALANPEVLNNFKNLKELKY